MKKFLAIFLSLFIGGLFILSAYSKLYPIEPFEYNIVGTTFFGWKSSVFIARIIIGLEFFIGLLLVFSYHHKFSVPLASALILLFSIHLIFQLLVKGNSGDCGCFGNLMAMTPLQGLLKNIGILTILFFIYKLRFNFRLKFRSLEFYAFVISMAAIFIVNPVDLGYAENYLNKPFENFKLELDTLYGNTIPERTERPPIDVRKGKHIVAFLSASCGHCKIAAQKISVLHQENPRIPIYFFINGEDEKIKRFRTVNNVEDIPYSKLNAQLFIEMAGLQLPVIYYLNNSMVEKQVDYFTLDQSHIEQWLAK